MGTIHVKLYGIWTSGSEGDVVRRHFLSGALAAPLFSRQELSVQFLIEGIMRNNSVKSFCFWTSGSEENAV